MEGSDGDHIESGDGTDDDKEVVVVVAERGVVGTVTRQGAARAESRSAVIVVVLVVAVVPVGLPEPGSPLCRGGAGVISVGVRWLDKAVARVVFGFAVVVVVVAVEAGRNGINNMGERGLIGSLERGLGSGC